MRNKDKADRAYGKSIEILNQTIEANPGNAEAWLSKAQALDSLGRSDEAIKAYDKVIELNPEKSDLAGIAWENKAGILMKLGNTMNPLTHMTKPLSRYLPTTPDCKPSS